VGYPRLLSDCEYYGVRSGTGAVKRWRRKKGGGCSLYSHQRRWTKPWARARRWPPLSEGGRRGLCAVRVVRQTLGAHTVLYFSELSKLAETCKLKIGGSHCSKKSQVLLMAVLGYYEQFSQLFQHPIPNRNRAENLGSDSTFESLMNLKRDLIFTKVNLVGITYMNEFELQYKCQTDWFE
jgi:hypothetical protein